MEMREVLEFYSKTPPNRGALWEYTLHYKEENRSCSDSIEVWILLEDGKIKNRSFDGMTSIITTATASIFWESIIGMQIEDIFSLWYEYIVELIGGEVSPRRQRASVFWLIATQNALHTYLWDGKKVEILDMFG